MSESDDKKSGSYKANVPESAFEEALRAVETISRKKKPLKKGKVPARPHAMPSKDALDIEGDADDLDSLLSLLDSKGTAVKPNAAKQPRVKPTPGNVSSQQSTYQLPDEDSILSDLLGEEVDLEKEAEFFRSVLFGESDTEPAQKARAKASKRPAPSEPSPGQEGEVKDLTEKITRLQAEFENYRKRVIREAKEAKKFYNDKLILDLLPIVDNFERAIEHMKNLAEQKSILEGVQLIYRQMLGMLENSGLQAIDTSDEKFNPLYHEALGTFVNDEVEPGTILTEYETGYLLNGRLLRPSKVLVARGSQNGNSDQKSEEPAEAASADIEPSDPDASEESSGDTESADSPGKKKTNGTE